MEKGQEISLFFPLSFSSTVVFFRFLLSLHVRTLEYRKFLLVESRISLTIGIQNPLSKAGIQFLGIPSHGMESQNPGLS